jgi:hypothetical protein
VQSHLDLKKSRRILLFLLLLLLLLLLSTAGLVALITAMYKDTYVKGDNTLSNAKGKVVGTRAATHDLPLLVASVLPHAELFSVETITVTLPGSRADPAEVGSEAGSGETINEVEDPGVVNSFRISRVEKVNSTVVVFHALGGEQIRLWNGVTTVRMSATGPEIPVCSANVTCAAFQVEGAELAEKYLAEAEAVLAPFVEGRRRLVDKCLDPRGKLGKKYLLRDQPKWAEAEKAALALVLGQGTENHVYYGYDNRYTDRWNCLISKAFTTCSDYAFEKTRGSTIIRRSPFYRFLVRGTLRVGPSVTEIKLRAFAHTDLEWLDLSEATALHTIDESAFEGTDLARSLLGKTVCAPQKCFNLIY